MPKENLGRVGGSRELRKNLGDWLAVFLPSYWLMIHPYSANWDKKLLRLLEEYEFTADDFTADDAYTAKLGDFTIWIENQPYGTMRPWNMAGLPELIRARRSTIHYAIRRLWHDLVITHDPFPAEPPSVAELNKLWEEK